MHDLQVATVFAILDEDCDEHTVTNGKTTRTSVATHGGFEAGVGGNAGRRKRRSTK